MNESQSHIPTEIYFDFLGQTIPIHWSYHAILLVGIWFVLVPLCIITIRYGKPKPTRYGIREEIRLTNIAWWWFSVHKYGFYLAVGLSLAGLAMALTVSRGFSGSVHSLFGLTTIILGCLQIVSAWLRGSHGGKYYHKADPDDPATWHGDHFDMTLRRRTFEAYHKTAGYFAGFFVVRRGGLRPDAISDARADGRHSDNRACRPCAVHCAGAQGAAIRWLPCGLWQRPRLPPQ